MIDDALSRGGAAIVASGVPSRVDRAVTLHAFPWISKKHCNSTKSVTNNTWPKVQATHFVPDQNDVEEPEYLVATIITLTYASARRMLG